MLAGQRRQQGEPYGDVAFDEILRQCIPNSAYTVRKLKAIKSFHVVAHSKYPGIYGWLRVGAFYTITQSGIVAARSHRAAEAAFGDPAGAGDQGLVAVDGAEELHADRHAVDGE